MYYFISDVHLSTETLDRERALIAWLDSVAGDADAIFLLGDVFDFWYEYKYVIPKGFSRLLGKLSELNDRNIPVHFFVGNHDLWAFDYLQKECGVILHHDAVTMTLYGKRVYMAHGDNIEVTAPMAKFMNFMFRSRTVQWIFSHILHPDFTMRFGHWWSGSSRKSKSISHVFRGGNEPMVKFARRYAPSNDVDLFIFGHTHCACMYDINNVSKAIFLGEWMQNPVYGELSERGMQLKKVKI